MIKLRFADFLATLFYVGYCPVAPGTAASLITVIAWWFLPACSVAFHVTLIMILFLIGLWSSVIVEHVHGSIDPSHIVIDEVVGMLVALICLPKTLLAYFIAFAFFRLFDITKIPPINFAEKHLKGAWGIMIDDLIAGLMALFCTWLLI